MQKKKKHSLSSKQRILEASAELIAVNGYAAVGIRKIAEKAGVNISMISYYFGSKIGILKSIMEDYNKEVFAIFFELRNKDLGLENGTKYFVKQMVELIKRKENICKVAMLEIPLDVPEISEHKLKLKKENHKIMKGSLRKYFKIFDKTEGLIMGPLFMSMVFSNFLFITPSKDFIDIKLDDKFYDKYAETISNVMLYGLIGYKKNNKNKK
ncbi:MAG: TetR family transcriptional regulator [Ignavibacteria bacterium]|nr:TetR family transcriptional regulator [Ignavibacteria bacterium]